MDNISQHELMMMQMDGAEIEMEPDTIIVEGLLDQLAKLVPKDNADIVAALKALVLTPHVTVDCTPIVESIHHSNNINNVSVDTTPIQQVMERLVQRHEYTFTVNRDSRGRIESMDARII